MKCLYYIIFSIGITLLIPLFSFANTGKISHSSSSVPSEKIEIQLPSSGTLDRQKDKKTPIESPQEDVSSDDKDPDDKDIDTEEEKKIKQDIDNYITESYKIQGTRIIKDLTTNFTRIFPNEKERKNAYMKIQESLKLREKRLDKMRTSEKKKKILREFLNHMIELLEKNIQDLSK